MGQVCSGGAMKRPRGSWRMPCLSPRRWEADDMGGVLLTGHAVIFYQTLENSHFCPKKFHHLHAKKSASIFHLENFSFIEVSQSVFAFLVISCWGIKLLISFVHSLNLQALFFFPLLQSPRTLCSFPKFPAGQENLEWS